MNTIAERRKSYKLPQCPGGDGCTCCHAGCDCGCVDDCVVYQEWNRVYVPPGQQEREGDK